MSRRYINTQKKTLRFPKRNDIINISKRNSFSFRDFLELIPLIVALVPIITSILFAIFFAYDYGQCIIFNISPKTYIGLSNTSLLTELILFISIGLGLCALNIIAYMIFMIKKRYSLILILSSALLAAFLSFIFIPKHFKVMFWNILPIFLFVDFLCFFPGTCLAFGDKLSKDFRNKEKLENAEKNNPLFRNFLISSALLFMILFSLFIINFIDSFNVDSLPFVEIDGQEYAVIYEGSDYYQLAYTERYIPTEDHASSNNNHSNRKTLNIILDSQMRVNKDNLLTSIRSVSLDDFEF